MDHAMVGQVHELTQLVNLTDVDPTIRLHSDRGLPFTPRHISVLYVKEDAGPWDRASVTVKGLSLKRALGTQPESAAYSVGVLTRSRTYSGSMSDLPRWVEGIVYETIPAVIVLEALRGVTP